MKFVPVLNRMIAAVLLLPAAGCGSSPTVHYYTLATPQGAEKAAGSASSSSPYAVAVGPVTVPATVDRPQFVIQVDPNRVVLLDDQRWAEPLNSAIPRAVASDLGQLLGMPTV